MSSLTTCQGTRPQSSQLAEPLWTDPGIKNEISVHELISTKKKWECWEGGSQGVNGQRLSQNPRKRGKSHHQNSFQKYLGANQTDQSTSQSSLLNTIGERFLPIHLSLIYMFELVSLVLFVYIFVCFNLGLFFFF